jgi:hypothetical protein
LDRGNGSAEDVSEIGPPTFGTIGKITDASLLPLPPLKTSDFDTQLSAQQGDLKIMISTACSGSGPNVEIETNRFPVHGIG